MSKTAWKISGSYVPKRLEMLQSPAWRAAPRAMKDWLEVLEIELMRHKGCANGQLFKSYTQFVSEGFNRGTVSEMSRIAEALGFVQVNRQTGIGSPDLREACAYTLTYLPSGTGRDIAPSDEWRRIKTEEQALRAIEGARRKRRKTTAAKVRRAA